MLKKGLKKFIPPPSSNIQKKQAQNKNKIFFMATTYTTSIDVYKVKIWFQRVLFLSECQFGTELA